MLPNTLRKDFRLFDFTAEKGKVKKKRPKKQKISQIQAARLPGPTQRQLFAGASISCGLCHAYIKPVS